MYSHIHIQLNAWLLLYSPMMPMGEINQEEEEEEVQKEQEEQERSFKLGLKQPWLSVSNS